MITEDDALNLGKEIAANMDRLLPVEEFFECPPEERAERLALAVNIGKAFMLCAILGINIRDDGSIILDPSQVEKMFEERRKDVRGALDALGE